jgi:hypothetical protein
MNKIQLLTKIAFVTLLKNVQRTRRLVLRMLAIFSLFFTMFEFLLVC